MEQQNLNPKLKINQYWYKIIDFFLPPHLIDEELNSIARILYSFILILIPSLIIISIIQLKVEDYTTIKTLVYCSIFLFISFILLKLKCVRVALFLTAFAILATITITCTYGQGIHDIAIIAYPAILIISSLLLKKRFFFILLILTISGLFWLVYGEQTGIFIAKEHGIGDWGDFVNITIILLISALLAYSIAHRFRKILVQKGNEILERKQVTAALNLSLEEKNILLKELHHRVKNNLNVINSLMNLQERYIKNKDQAIKAFHDLHHRIYSMALIYETMYHAETVNKIKFAPYTKDIINKMLSEENYEHIKITVSIENVFIALDKAIPCEMIITEALSNALVYAFPNKKPGEIKIKMHQGHDHICSLEISDNGIGLPEDLDVKNHSQSFGFQLLYLMAEQLNAELKLDSQKNIGTTIQLKFAGNT